ncbi:hypothetical protein [Actinoalloteichus hymeniacidonis]|uniref:Spore-associated protein A n=1 Tax=Actinoalloteichus hymeniacidonis TaxID=340345 RepID=A0AAC9HS60_9PSEU|nr:hypothetical protein [Actinoalloteichus hymeniacidonis]AOS64612.1 hypothetical protein TL08_19105 [Actinoalloteichus hymeniacidonis]MBB5907315.1 hypothetical protein [Actinoalloteichus hymeniacidonis]
MRRTTRLGTTLLAALAATLVAVGLAPSAAAHSRAEAIEVGCGTGFVVVNDGVRQVTTPSGATWGEVYLTYNNATGQNCVVTNKTSHHGTATRTVANLYVQQSGGTVRTYSDSGSYSHYANVTASGAAACVLYDGHIWDASGRVLASGGRETWGNCG